MVRRMVRRAVVVDYGVGNVHSATRALARAAAESSSAWSVVLTDDADLVARADAALLPGVGSFGGCSDGLARLREALAARHKAGLPTLGVCVGLQLFADSGEERGERAGLGWIPGRARPLARSRGARMPHMGWNAITSTRAHPIMEGLEGAMMYFAHAYALAPDDAADIVARTTYGADFASVCARGAVVGTQFHPEKSQATGLRLLANFLAWRP